METNGHPDRKTREYALYCDSRDPLAHLRNEFIIPTKADILHDSVTEQLVKDVEHPSSTAPTSTSAFTQPKISIPLSTTEQSTQNDRSSDTSTNPCLYLCGNSLGLQPLRSRKLINEELDVWARRGVVGHHDHPLSRPWVTIDEHVTAITADIVGARTDEVAVMGSLTSNIHHLFAAFYRPTKERWKIVIEAKAFPSDHYAMESQLRLHGHDPSTSLICIAPQPGDHTLHTANILQTLTDNADTIAVCFLSGVQYYTGQAFDIPVITAHAQKLGITVGWDLAHAVGNIELKLHDWNVDFAAWCTYKYLNSGPGGIAGLFVHERESGRLRQAGWWGHEKGTRFDMGPVFKPIPGAAGFQHSNPSVISTVCLLGSLQVFSQTSMTEIRQKSVALTGYLESLLDDVMAKHPVFTIITPRDPKSRGAQLSLNFKDDYMVPVLDRLTAQAVVVDERKPNTIRVAPIPLYNTFEDVWRFVDVLREVIEEVEGAK